MKKIPNSRAVGKEVRKRRRALKLTQGQLAEKSGVSQRLIAALELGDAKGIQLNKLLQVLEALGMSLHVDAPDTKTLRSGKGRKGAQAVQAEYETAFAEASERYGAPLLSSLREDAGGNGGARK